MDGSLAVEKCMGKEFGFGYNAATDKYENLLEAGILDPAKVIDILILYTTIANNTIPYHTIPYHTIR